MVNIGADRSPERARQDYVKAIYQLGETRPVRAATLARSLGVSRASVSKFKRLLERDHLLHRSRHPTDTLRLTKKGHDLAVRMVRRHRLVETFLHATLHVPLERVHSEAERIEHAISDDVSLRLAQFLEHPAVDPHGHRIPRARGRQAATPDLPLAAADPRQRIIITRLDDNNVAIVRRLAALGVLPGLRAMVAIKNRSAIQLRAHDRTIVVSPAEAARVHFAPERRG